MQLLDATHIDSIPALCKVNPHVRIIGMSGGLSLIEIAPELQEKLFCFIPKPFSFNDLLAKVQLSHAQ